MKTLKNARDVETAGMLVVNRQAEEARAAAPAQPRALDLVDDRLVVTVDGEQLRAERHDV